MCLLTHRDPLKSDIMLRNKFVWKSLIGNKKLYKVRLFDLYKKINIMIYDLYWEYQPYSCLLSNIVKTIRQTF